MRLPYALIRSNASIVMSVCIPYCCMEFVGGDAKCRKLRLEESSIKCAAFRSKTGAGNRVKRAKFCGAIAITLPPSPLDLSVITLFKPERSLGQDTSTSLTGLARVEDKNPRTATVPASSKTVSPSLSTTTVSIPAL